MHRPTFIWLLLGLIWGSTWLFIKLGLADLPPFTFAGIRFAIAALPLVVLVRVRRIVLPPARSDRWLLLTTALLTAASYGGVFWGEAQISSGLTAILFTTYPLFGLLLAHWLVPAEPLTVRRLLGVLLGIAGVVVIFGDQVGGSDTLAPWGSAAVVASAAVAALTGVLIKSRGGHLDPLLVTTAQMGVGAVPLLIVGFALEGGPAVLRWTPLAVASLLYLALVGSSLAFVLWWRLVREIEVTRAQLLPLVNTLVAVLLGWIVLAETPSRWAALGGSAVLAGLVLSLTDRRSAAIG